MHLDIYDYFAALKSEDDGPSMGISSKSIRHILYRPSSKPSIPIALGARSVGHYRVMSDYRDRVAVKYFVQIFWCARGTGALVINGRERLLRPDQVALYFPGHKHQVYAKAEPWEYRWWTMDGPLAESIVSEFGLVPGVFDTTPPPVDLFHKLEKAILNLTPTGERKASILAYQLLTRAAAGSQPVTAVTQVEKALAAAHQQWSNPNFSIKALADDLGIHRSQLSREFRRVMGIPLMAYILRLRLQKALSLLKATDQPILKIAPQCGFQDPNYFARLIRRKFNTSPSQIRRRG